MFKIRVFPFKTDQTPVIRNLGTRALKTLTSLNEGVRSFFLGDNSMWRFPSVSSLSDYSIRRS